MAQAPLDRSLARPTDAPPLAHVEGEPAATEAVPPAAEAPLLPPEDLPRHVAIIMDGNRRWARARDLPDFDGHAAGGTASVAAGSPSTCARGGASVGRASERSSGAWATRPP